MFLYTELFSMQSTCTILLFVAFLALQYSYTLLYMWHDFWKKVIEHKMCVLILSSTFMYSILLH